VVRGVSAGAATIRATAAGGVFAEKTITVTAVGTPPGGSADNPFIIMTAADLDNLRNNPTAHYKLGANIDLTSYLAPGGAGFSQWGAAGWMPIGNDDTPDSMRFIGGLDGAGFKITGLWIDRPTTGHVGLFGYIQDATIKNLGVEIAAAGIKGWGYVGGIAGRVDRSGISNCYTTGTVSGSGHGNWVGGVAGEVIGGSISNCYATGAISGGGNVGGVAGGLLGGSISHCYATGAVSDGGGGGVGGVAGGILFGSVSHCYATGAVSGRDWVGGVAGYVENGGSVSNCVALNPSVTLASGSSLGRVAGYNVGTLSHNFARSAGMTLTPSKTLDVGGNTLDGADCAASPTPEWWTTAPTSGPNWSTTHWTFTNGQLPQLRNMP